MIDDTALSRHSHRLPPPTWDAVLVAGGHGRRAGGPKALAMRDGRLMWRWQVAAMRAAGCGTIAAVLHPMAMPASNVAEALAHVRCVEADADAEMIASLQLGLRALARAQPDGRNAGPTRPVFMLPVDCPCPGAPVFAALGRAAVALELQSQPWQVVRPWVDTSSGRRRGHPVVLGPALIGAVVSLDARTGRLDRLISALPETQRIDVQVKDERICGNFNYGGLGTYET